MDNFGNRLYVRGIILYICSVEYCMIFIEICVIFS